MFKYSHSNLFINIMIQELPYKAREIRLKARQNLIIIDNISFKKLHLIILCAECILIMRWTLVNWFVDFYTSLFLFCFISFNIASFFYTSFFYFSLSLYLYRTLCLFFFLNSLLYICLYFFLTFLFLVCICFLSTSSSIFFNLFFSTHLFFHGFSHIRRKKYDKLEKDFSVTPFVL